MILRLTLLTAALCASAVGLAPPALGQESDGQRPLVHSVPLDMTIDPVSADWVKKSIDDAEKADAELVIFELDTPGGLEDSMREIVKEILGAPMPVVVYVSPNGARAASAGVFVTQAADVAAMAPQTNIGSATPINATGGDVGGTLGRKIRNDAAAFIRVLAEEHGRNAQLGEQMVREATNVTAGEARQQDFIDLVSTNEQQLVKRLDGFHVKGSKAQTLHTAGAVIEKQDVPFRFELLSILINPNTVFLLFTIGLIGLGFELFNPGAIFPGAIGAIALILALFGLAQLPVTAAGILLILLAFGLLVAEAFIVSHGALTAGGIIALVAGGLLLFDTDNSAVDVSLPIVVFTAALLGLFFVFVMGKAVQARHGQVHTGSEELVGMSGVVRQRLAPVGQVFIQGALWRARSVDRSELPVGAKVTVERVEGLTLDVVPSGDPAAQSDEAARE